MANKHEVDQKSGERGPFYHDYKEDDGTHVVVKSKIDSNGNVVVMSIEKINKTQIMRND